MKGTSDQYLEITIQSNGKTQVRYNIEPFTKTMMDKEQSGYEYDYVEIEGDLTRAKIIDAVIADTYSKDAEFALINNEIASPGTEQYKAYQELRVKAKEIAATVII
jgi:hypothetical protein